MRTTFSPNSNLFASTEVQTPRFGWRPDSPPDYMMPLTLADFADIETLRPTQQWLQQAAHKMVGNSDDTPRFICVPNITDFTNDIEQVHTFQKRLIGWVATEIRKTHPNLVTPQAKADQDFIREKGWFLRGGELNGAKKFDFNSPQNNHGGYGVYTGIHADSQTSPIISLSYGPYKNVRGGAPLMTDMRQFARDKQQTIDQVTKPEPHTKPHDDDYETLRTKYALRLPNSHFDPVNQIPIVMFNNANGVSDEALAGVFHGATQVSRQDAQKPIKRPLYKAWLGMDDLAKYEHCDGVELLPFIL